MEEISSGIEQINSGGHEIATASEEQAASISEVAASAQNLTQVSDRLKILVGQKSWSLDELGGISKIRY